MKAALTLVIAALTGLTACQSQADSTLKAYSVTSGNGPMPATAFLTTSMPDNTLFLPVNLPSKPMPLVLWANGGCRSDPLRYGVFLRELASQGYAVIAAGVAKEEGKTVFDEELEKRQQGPQPDRGPVGNQDDTTAEQLIAGLDWAEQRNSDRNSTLYQKLDTEHVAVMGHSCGGLQAMQVATDPRLDTAVIFNSGVINTPMQVQSTALKVRKDILEKLSVPMLYINGGPTDVAYFNALDDFERIEHLPVVFAENGVGHGGTFRYPDGGAYAQVVSHWLNWQLKQDSSEKQWFVGSDCHLCQDFDWQIKQKHVN